MKKQRQIDPKASDFFPLRGIDYIEIYVGNAKQAASFYVTRMGFSPYAYQGLENGNRESVTHVVKNGNVIIALQSALKTGTTFEKDFSEHLIKHGDGIKDIALSVEDCTHTYNIAVNRGATSIKQPTRLEDSNGWVIIASVQTFGDTIHTFVERQNFTGAFLPGFTALQEDPINSLFEMNELNKIDHIVSNHPLGDMEPTVSFYEKVFDFHRFWSIDDTLASTEFSSLKSIVVADADENVLLPQSEPAIGKKKSQTQEYVDYYNGSGVQHVALNVSNIVSVVTNLKKRGMQFLDIPKQYYIDLRKKLENSPVDIREDIDTLEKLKILVDYDDKGYLLQIFTKNVEDRPTLFFEFIQRCNHNGFGAGNFKSLFEAIEREQAKRGNLTDI